MSTAAPIPSLFPGAAHGLRAMPVRGCFLVPGVSWASMSEQRWLFRGTLSEKGVFDVR